MPGSQAFGINFAVGESMAIALVLILNVNYSWRQSWCLAGWNEARWWTLECTKTFYILILVLDRQ